LKKTRVRLPSASVGRHENYRGNTPFTYIGFIVLGAPRVCTYEKLLLLDAPRYEIQVDLKIDTVNVLQLLNIAARAVFFEEITLHVYNSHISLRKRCD
jgi:hypothetical protein